MATIVVTDPPGDPGQQYDWVSNPDGTWRGPLEGEDMLTLQQVFDQIRRLQVGGLEVELPPTMFVVSCCTRAFLTADAADQHEAEHEGSTGSWTWQEWKAEVERLAKKYEAEHEGRQS